MPTQITDFRYVMAGRLPDDFADLWGSAPCLSRVYEAEPPENARLAFDPLGSTLAAVKWVSMDAVGVSPNHGNQEIEARIQFLDDATQIGPGLRIGGTSPAAASGYFLEFRPLAGAMTVKKYVAGSATTVGSAAAIAVGLGPLRVRFRCFTVSGTTTLWARVWPEGGTEPGTWAINGVTDASSPHTDGAIGFGTRAAVRYRVDVLSAATDAATAGAPEFSTIPRSFADTLAAEGAQLAWSARVESRIIATDVEDVRWFGTPLSPQATAYADCPVGAPMPGVLRDARPASETLNADVVFSGRSASAPPEVTFDNRDRVFDDSRTYAGRMLTLYCGEAFDPATGEPRDHRWHVAVSTGVIDGEPELKSREGTAVFGLLSRSAPPKGEGERGRGRGIERSSEPMDVRRFVGIPTLLLGGIATIPANARMQIKSFTVFHRYLIDNAPGSTQRISGIESSSTARQWRADIGTDGRIRVTASVGGVADVVDLTTPLSVVGDFGWYAISIDAERNEALLLTERDEIYQTLGGVVATPASALMAGYGAGHYQLDLRFYDLALTAAEIRALADSRDDTSPSLSGSWRFDDNTGNTVTDYVNANNGTIAGTVNVNFFWMSSDLGEPEQAGRYMPMSEGHLFNGLAVICNDGLKRWRWNDRLTPLEPVTSNPEFKVAAVRVRGVPVALTTDYTLPTTPAGAVIQFSGGGDEPVNFDTGFAATPTAGGLLPGLLCSMAVRRSGLTPDVDLDSQAWDAMRALYAWPAGYYSEGQAESWAQVASDALAGVGAHLRDDRFGRIFPWALHQTINPGPYGMAPHLEFLGSPGGGVRFHDLPALTANTPVTIVMWVRPHSVLGDPVAVAGTQPRWQEFLSTFDSANTAGLACGIHAGRDGAAIFSHSGVTSQQGDAEWPIGSPHSQTRAGKLRPDEWAVVAFKLTNFNGAAAPFGNYQSTIYGAQKGASAVVELSSLTVHGTRAAGGGIRIGSCFAGSISHVVIYDADLSAAALTPILSAPPSTTNAIFYAALNEGSGRYVLDQISGRYGAVTGAQWCPQIVLDPAAGSVGVSESSRTPLPAWRAGATYAANQSPLSESDIATGVTNRGERARLRDDSMLAELSDQAIREGYRQSRNFDLAPPVLARKYALEVARAVRARFAVGLRGVLSSFQGATKESGADMRLLGLPLCSEIWLKDAANGDTSYRPYRVVSKEPPGLSGESSSAQLWFGRDPG